MTVTIILTFIVFQALLLIVHLTVYATMAAAFGFDSTVLRLVFALLSLTFVTASLMVHWSRNRVAQWYYTFSAYWFGLVHFLFGGGVLFFLVLILANAFHWSLNLALIGGICFGAFFLLHLYGTWNSGRAGVSRITVPLGNLPEYWRDHVMVFMSDVHLGAIRGAGFAKKVVGVANSFAPALVVIGGDLYDGVKCDVEAVVAPFANIKAEHGTYYITGNHEFYGEFDRSMAAIKSVGIRILKNETATVEGIRFTGVDYQDVHKKEDFARILEGITLVKEAPNILVKHEPDNLDIAEQKGFSAGFFGHTHRGQIWPLSIITRRMYHGFDYGLKKLKNMWVYTSSGVGTWGPPLRLGTKSEIIIVQFKKS
jgi:predicted MPP superfamily phosphohydrolase